MEKDMNEIVFKILQKHNSNPDYSVEKAQKEEIVAQVLGLDSITFTTLIIDLELGLDIQFLDANIYSRWLTFEELFKEIEKARLVKDKNDC